MEGQGGLMEGRGGGLMEGQGGANGGAVEG